jgi:hypothetical protein
MLRTRSVALVACLVIVACGTADKVVQQGPPQNDPPNVPVDAGVTTPAADASVPPWCPDATGVYNATPETSNVLFLIDRSGSMQIKLSDNSTRWTATKKGFFDLLGALSNTGVRAGAMMFPQGDAPITCCSISSKLNDVVCNCATGQLPTEAARCSEKTYQVPVPVSNLDAQQTSDIQAYVSGSDTSFYWGTPLATALQSAIDAQKANPAQGTKSVVLLTDGYPTSCDTKTDPSANDIQRVIAAAATGTNGNALVRTFVLGVIDGTKGARADYLSPIAKAGGTGRTNTCDQANDCFYPLNAKSFATDLKAALDQIALQAFDCTFNLPKTNGSADLSKINVVLTDKNGSTTVARDNSHQNGWDYLPNQTQVQLYGGACQAVRGDAAAKVQIVLGCKTLGQ